MGLLLMIGAGIVNAVLDYVLIVICDMGVAGAALATGIGQCIPAIAGLVFSCFPKVSFGLPDSSFPCGSLDMPAITVLQRWYQSFQILL